MTRFLTVAALAAMMVASVGCGCRRPFLNWFNRGDSCEVCGPDGHYPTSAPVAAGYGGNMFEGEQLAGEPVFQEGGPIGGMPIEGGPIGGVRENLPGPVGGR